MPYKYKKNNDIVFSYVNPYPAPPVLILFCNQDTTGMDDINANITYQFDTVDTFCNQDTTGMDDINYTVVYDFDTVDTFCDQNTTGMDTFTQAP